MKIQFRVLLSSLTLIAGVTIYSAYRPTSLLNGALGIESISNITWNDIPDWLIYSLPDALWYVALLLLQPIPRKDRISISSRVLTLTAVALPFIHEGLQYLGVAPGSFCFIDLSFYLIILILYIVCLGKRFTLLFKQV